jgi:ElaB/YqjD/DUF883 family membrane-anchored ribosome-binding protein
MARRSAVNGARGAASDLREVAEDNAHEAVDTARRYGREKSNELYDKATNAFERGIGDIDKLVRNNPVTALAAALAIGFVLGARR